MTDYFISSVQYNYIFMFTRLFTDCSAFGSGFDSRVECYWGCSAVAMSLDMCPVDGIRFPSISSDLNFLQAMYRYSTTDIPHTVT